MKLPLLSPSSYSTELTSYLELIEVEYKKYPWKELDDKNFNKKGDYCFIFSYPPVRTLKPIKEDDLFILSQYGSLEEPANLYIHVPYCTAICSYCYFAKVVDNPKRNPVLKSDYPDTLKFEMQRICERSNQSPLISSIHFGGGTPSLLEVDELSRIMAFIKEFKLADNIEITLEFAPETIIENPDKLKAFQDLGINRVNLGVESLDDEILKIMGRRHDSEETLKALELIFDSGYKNINVDLIYDLPHQSLESWMNTLLILDKMGVHSISAYRLRKHPMKKISHREPEDYPRYETGLKMQVANEVLLLDRGYVRSSSHKYAREESKLQVQIENKRGVVTSQLISIGCGAYGFVNNTFYWNTKSLKEYGESIEQGTLPVHIGQVLDKEESMRKVMVMGMHTNKGISINGFKERYNEDPCVYFNKEISELKKIGLLQMSGGNIQPTEMGRFFSDEISVYFFSKSVKAKLESLGMQYGMFWERDKYA